MTPAAAQSTAQTMADHLRAVMRASPLAGAVLFEECWYSWAALDTCGLSLVDTLSSAGVPVSTPVGLVTRNRPTTVAALLGLLVNDYPPVLVSSVQPPPAIVHTLEELSPGAIVADRQDWTDDLLAMVDEIGAVGVALDHESRSLAVELVVRGAGRSRSHLRIAPAAAMVVPTSGTTGPPKPIEVDWADLPLDLGTTPRASDDASQRPPVIHALSMATITGVMGVLHAVGRQRPLALLERLDVSRWASLVHRFRLRRAGLPPAAMRSILDERVPPQQLASLEAWVTGSAAIDPQLQEEFEATYGVPVLVAYGATEFGGAVTSWTLEDHGRWAREKRGSVGRPLEGIDLRVVDVERGEVLPRGEQGLLEVRRQRADGARPWIRTNDLARLDGDEFLFIDGRADDVIVRGGFKVPLNELEALIRTHPAVREAAAVGLPEPRLGQVPAVAVVLGDGQATTPEVLVEWLHERVAPYKVPVVLRIVDSLPQSSSHKVSRPAVCQMLASDPETPV